MNVLRYVFLWGICMTLCIAAVLLLEAIEGNRITDSMYGGYANFGLPVMFMLACAVAFICSLCFVGLTIMIDRWVKFAALRLFVLVGLGVLLSLPLFNRWFGAEYVEGYDLQIFTAVWLFGAAGLIYGLANEMLRRSQRNRQLRDRIDRK